ncbi:GAF domain-containing protein [Kineococcus sp. NBC_00420]|uniref:GAF domain-containing protein n=1 Tax=Kineococcus sp. NBC_00420 TaxID=2903564 RepID=UPI002E1AAAB8
MISVERVRAGLAAAVADAATPLSAADRLCQACVELLDVDGAAISIVHAGATHGTFGSSNALSRRLDAYQFVYGEGPCLDAVAQHRPVLAEDLTNAEAQRWPAFSASVVEAGVRAVFALPVGVAGDSVGALDLFRHQAGPLSAGAFSGGLLAARLASLPVLDLIAQIEVRASEGVIEGAEQDPWSELESLDRVEIYQATGFLIAQLSDSTPNTPSTPSDAVIRLRGRAFVTGQTASEVAWEILEGRLSIDADGEWRVSGGAGGPDTTSERGTQ